MGGEGYWADIQALGQAVLAAAEAAGDQVALGWTHAIIGRSGGFTGAHDEGRAHLARALDHFRCAGDLSGQASAHLFASYLDSLKRDWAEAITRGGQALALFRRTGDQAGQGWALAVLGDCHARLENYELARGYARQVLEVTPEAGDPTTFAMAWDTLGLVHSRLGGPHPAITCYRQALAFLRGRKQPLARLMQIIMLPEFGDACLAADDLPAAAGAWQQAQQIRRELAWPESRGSAPGSSRPGRPAPQADRQAPVPALSGRARAGHPQVPRSPYPAASARRARDLPRYRQHTASTPEAGTVKSAGPGVQAPAPRSRDRPRSRKRKETTMTTNQPADTAAAPPDTAIGRAGTPRRRLIILASVVLVLLAAVIAAVVTALSPPAASAAHGAARPLTGTGTGTTTLNLLTGAATSKFTGHLSPLGAESGYDNLTFTLTGASTFTYTGTRIFVAANGDKLFSAITGQGTFTRTTAKSTETDTITGGTGPFAGASGTYTDTISSVVISATSTSQISQSTAIAQGQIRY